MPKLFKSHHSLFALIVLFCISSSVHAESEANSFWLEKIANGITQLYAHSVANAQAKLELAKQMLYQPTPEIGSTVAANTNQQSNNNESELANTVTNKLVGNSDSSDMLINFILLPGSDYQPSNETINIYGKDKPKLSNPNNMAFNFDALMSPATMAMASPEQQASADNSSQLANYYTNLLSGTDSLSVKIASNKQVLLDNKLLYYLVNLRQYVAQQSLGISNLNYVLNERKPIQNLAVKAGLPDRDKNPNASPAQIDEYMAKKRATNSNWYLSMETAAPATVARETLYVLAEMRYEMYRNRLLQERILATLAAMQLNQLKPNADGLAQLKQDLVSRGMVTTK